MKVLHVITSLSRGGAEAMLGKLLAGIDRERFSAMVVSLTSRSVVGDEIAGLGYDVAALEGTNGILGPRQILRLRRIAATYSPDLIHAWMYHANLAAHLFLRGRAPLLASVRGGTQSPETEKRLTRIVRNLDARFSRRAAGVLYNSKRAARQHETLGYDARRTVVIPNGFDTDRFFRDEAARARLREQLQAGANTRVVILVARFHPVKGHAVLLDAARTLRAHEADWMFWLVGRGCDPANVELAKEIAERNLDQCVIKLLGERTDLPALYSAADACVCPSLSESFPNAVGEAMASELPCVVADVGDCVELVGDTGLVFARADGSGLAKCLQALFVESYEARRQRGRAARQRIMQAFSMSAVIGRYEQLYTQLTAVPG